MKCQLLLAIGILSVAVVAAGQETRPPRHLILVIDGSRHMQEPFAAEGQTGGSPSTRLTVARAAALNLLDGLAKSKQQVVSVVLYGHQGAASPSAPPTSIADAVTIVRGGPGAAKAKAYDAEIVHDSRLLSAAALAEMRQTILDLKGDGEAAPLMAANKTASMIPPAAPAGSAAVIMITSAASDRPEPAGSLAKQLVIQSLQGKATFHVVRIGNGGDPTTTHELAEIATATGGDVYAPETQEQATESALIAARLAPPRRTVAKLQVRPASQETMAQGPVVVRGDAGEQLADVAIQVTLYGVPVKDAKIVLRGASFDMAYDRNNEYKNVVLRQRRYDGVYVIQNVPFGPYSMEITANAKNRNYVLVRPIEVTPGNRIPERSFKVELEKTKFPPPIGPTPPPVAPPGP